MLGPKLTTRKENVVVIVKLVCWLTNLTLKKYLIYTQTYNVNLNLQLGEGMKDMGMKITAEEAEHMVQKADLDGDGFLSFHEFSKMMIAASY